MILILFSTIIGTIMLFIKIKEFLHNKTLLEQILSTNDFQHYSFHSFFSLLYFVIIVSGIASGIYGYIHSDKPTIAMGIVIAMLFTGELLNSPFKYSLYYNDNYFIVKGKKIRYKSIKRFEVIKNIPFAFVKIFTINSEEYHVSQKSYKIINKKYENLKSK